ncbi:hypothetical protein MNAN1_000576 [Malassezia nana]|uniref:Uncharacterized protein n=1 Tax=Malassezia nana TaxID=180528 RepID=A0AAF0J2G4_9BASI|nr:hypothetical protein MNAN1_000576 [Malassezia nana]
MASRHATAWDVAAMRMSSLHANDALPDTARVTSLKPLHGVRPIPLAPGATASATRSARRDPYDLAPMTLVLRSDTQIPLDPKSVTDESYATAQLRRQRRVVGGSVERASPYWRAARTRSRQLPAPRTDGPQRARLFVTRGEWARCLAASIRTQSLARQAKAGPQATAAPEAPEENATLTDQIHAMLPRLAHWDEAEEQQLHDHHFGWLHAPPCDDRVPRSTLLQALHYYVAHFYHTHGLLRPVMAPAASTDAPPHECERIRDETTRPMPDMEPGSHLWAYWARHSVGWARTMACRFDADALVALGVLVEALVEQVSPQATTAPLSSPVQNSHDAAAAFCEARRRTTPVQGTSRYWAHSM